MNTGTSALQCTQRNPSILDGVSASSPSQYRHLKWMVEVMKPVVVTLLVAATIQAQSLADAARQEKERRANLQTKVVAAVDNSQSAPATEPAKPKPEDTKSAELKPPQETPKPQTPPVDPQKLWNEQLDRLRAKVRALQDKEMALLLQLNEATNQVYAVVTDPATQEKSQSQLAHIQEQVAAVRKDLLEAGKTLEGMMLSGPPKK